MLLWLSAQLLASPLGDPKGVRQIATSLQSLKYPCYCYVVNGSTCERHDPEPLK